VRLLLDEMHAPAVAAWLRDLGWDVVAVKERPDLVGLADPDLLMASTADRRPLVTENIKDFVALDRQLAARGEHHAGIAFTHPKRFPRSSRNHVSALADAASAFLDRHTARLQQVESLIWWLERPR